MDKLGIGRKMERVVMARWVWHGYNCWQPPRSKWTSQDVWGLFDFVAIKPLCPVNLVQVKRHRASELVVAKDAMEAFCRDYSCPIACFVVSWQKNASRTLFRAYEYVLTGWVDAGQWTEEL